MENVDIKLLQAGFEDIHSYNHNTPEAKFTIAFYNRVNNKDESRSIMETIDQDGMESIGSFVSETVTRTIGVVKGWFNDYGKAELERIKKDFPKGMDAFKAANTAEMIKELKGIIERLKSFKSSNKSYEEQVNKAINLCNLAIGRLNSNNHHEVDRMMDDIRGYLEKYACEMFAKQYWFNRVAKEFKTLKANKVLKEMVEDIALIKSSFLNDGEKEANKILKKMETIRNNGNKYYDIYKTGVIKDISNFIFNFLDLVNTLLRNIFTIDKEIKDLDENEVVSVSKDGYNFKVRDLRGYIFFIYMMTKDLIEGIEDIEREFKDANLKAYYRFAGLTAEETKVFLDKI